MVVDTEWGLIIKKNEIMSILQNNPELSEDILDSYLSKIQMYDAEIEFIRSIF